MTAKHKIDIIMNKRNSGMEWYRNAYLYGISLKIKLNSVAWVRERNIPTERPPFVGEVSANFCVKRVPRGRRDGSLRQYSLISRPGHFTTIQIIPSTWQERQHRRFDKRKYRIGTNFAMFYINISTIQFNSRRWNTINLSPSLEVLLPISPPDPNQLHEANSFLTALSRRLCLSRTHNRVITVPWETVS
jgi:hypothetical protein